MTNPDVVIDTSEASSNPTLVKGLREKKLKVKKENLPAGDIVLNRKKRILLIERKNARDLAGSVRDGRIWIQIRKMKQRQKEIDCDLAILIEGSLHMITKYGKMSRSSVMGVYDAIRDPDTYGIEIIGPLPSKLWTIDWIASNINRNKKINKKTLRSLTKTMPSTLTPKEKKRMALEVLPGIGAVTADRILRRDGTVVNAYANVKSWGEIKGISPKVVKNCDKIINSMYIKKV